VATAGLAATAGSSPETAVPAAQAGSAVAAVPAGPD
jgi:hypothetical protein